MTGSRFFELKTVQIMDGAELSACVNKPCIKADDECYNCEWSTELYVPQAMEEYIKAWFLLQSNGKRIRTGQHGRLPVQYQSWDTIWKELNRRR